MADRFIGLDEGKTRDFFNFSRIKNGSKVQSIKRRKRREEKYVFIPFQKK